MGIFSDSTFMGKISHLVLLPPRKISKEEFLVLREVPPPSDEYTWAGAWVARPAGYQVLMTATIFDVDGPRVLLDPPYTLPRESFVRRIVKVNPSYRSGW